MEMMNSQRKKLICALGLLLSMIVAGLLCPPVFYLNDDVTMRSILSGAYTGTPDGHAVYMGYPLTGLLALLYRLLPMVPWLELFFAGCIWVCMYLTAEGFKSKLLGAVTSMVLYLPFFVYMHYTLVAALVAGCGVFLLCRGKRSIPSLLLLWTAYMIRSQVGLLSIPFVGAALVWRFLQAEPEERRQKIRSGLKQAGCLAAGLLIIILIHRLCYSSEEWQAYLQYNDSRTQLYDYTDFLSTDKYQEEYAAYGMTLTEYQLLSSYNTMLDDGIDSTKMQEIADKVTEGMESYAPGWKEVVKQYYLQIRYSDFPYNVLWMAAYVMLAVLLVWKLKWLQLGFVGILGIGRSVVWMYLISQGRFPERVSLSLYMIELLLLLSIGLPVIQKQLSAWKVPVQRTVMVACVVVMLVPGGWLTVNTREKVAQRVEVQAGWNLLREYCSTHAENTYLMDVFSSVRYADNQYTKDASNLMLLGGWLTASPLTKERLEGLGGEDAAQVLCLQENAYLVTEPEADVLWLESYLQERFGEVSLVKVDEISRRGGGFCIYKTIVQP